MAYVKVEVDVDLSEFSDQDLIDELETRNGGALDNNVDLIRQIYELHRINQDYSKQLNELFYTILGRVV